MTRKVFVDLDGVLADMKAGYLAKFGVPLSRTDPDPKEMWENINRAPHFFADLPMVADALDLWRGIKALGVTPIILSGYSEKCADAPEQKRWWVRKWLGKHVHMIFCKASEKRVFGHPGDILIDDWLKHADKWREMGGVFIVHTSAAESLVALKAVLGGGMSDPHPTAAKYRIWVAECAFKKNGFPSLGSFGSSSRNVVIMSVETWKRLCADVPQLQTTEFEVGSQE